MDQKASETGGQVAENLSLREVIEKDLPEEVKVALEAMQRVVRQRRATRPQRVPEQRYFRVF